MAFPLDRLATRVELAFGATASESPLDWFWTDVSSRRSSQVIGLTRGRAEGSASPQPTSLNLELDNLDGAITPEVSPLVRLGLPVRYWVEGRTPALVLPDFDSRAETPDSLALELTGDLDIRVRVAPDQWAGINNTDSQVIIEQGASAGGYSWSARLNPDGQPSMLISTDGTTLSTLTSPRRVAELRPVWLGFVLDVDNGASGRTLSCYKSRDETPPAVVSQWEWLGDDTIPGTGPVHNSAQPLTIGALSGNGLRGRVLAVEIRNGQDGPLVAAVDFTTATEGAAAVVGSTGETYTLAGAARVTTERIRFVGQVTKADPIWPHGDNSPNNPARPTESRLQIEASDLTRRLNRTGRPLRSSIYRAVAGNPDVAAYWPCEENNGATLLSAADIDVDPLTVSANVQAGQESTLASSAPLPTVQGGKTASWSGVVPPPAVFLNAWVAEMMFHIPEADATEVEILKLDTQGTAATWTVTVNDSLLRVVVEDGAQVELDNVAGGHSGDAIGGWVKLYLRAIESSGTVFWEYSLQPVGADAGGLTNSFAGTGGRVTGIGASFTAPPGGLSFGHVLVHNDGPSDDWTDHAINGWVGESAAHRVSRLCREEGIAVEILGDPFLAEPLGSLDYAEPMGPQARAKLLDLLYECVDVDGGVLVSRRRAPGFVYRTRLSLEAQDPVLELDAGNEEIARPFRPRYDMQRTLNKATVSAKAGSSGSAVDQTHLDTHGPFEEDFTINGVGGVAISPGTLTLQNGLAEAVATQNQRNAARRVYAGTWPGLRYPQISTDLGNAPQLIDAYHDLETGDIVTVTGLPVQHPAGTVSLFVEAVNEPTSPTEWRPTLTCSQGGPWLSPLTFEAPIVLVATNELPFAVPNDFRSSWDVQIPQGVQAGDLIEIVLGQQESAEDGRIFPTTIPAGFQTRHQLPAVFASQTPMMTKVYKRGADVTGAEGGTSVTFTFGGLTRLYAVVKVWRNVDPTNPYDIPNPVDISGTQDPDPQAVTTVNDGAVVTVDVAGNRDPDAAATISSGYAIAVTQLPAIKGIVSIYRTNLTASIENPSAWDWDVDNSTAITDALRPTGGGGLPTPAPASARIDSSRLLIDLHPEDPLTWGKDRPADGGQVIEAGNRFNPGLDDNLNLGAGYGLSWDDTGAVIDGAFTMQDGRLQRLRLGIHQGQYIIDSATQYVEDGSYTYQPTVNNTALNVPPSDALFADGTRGQQSFIADLATDPNAVRVGPSGDTVRVGFAFVVDQWMFGDDFTTSPTELHEPGEGKTSPILCQIRLGELRVFSRPPLTTVAPNDGNPGAGMLLGSVPLGQVLDWFAAVMEYRVDPNGTGFLNFWTVATDGTMTLQFSRGNDWGWIYDQNHPDYTDENDRFYIMARQHYTFHNAQSASLNNWDTAGRGGNVQRLGTRRFAAALGTGVGTDELAGDLRWHLNPDDRWQLLYQTDWTDPNVLDEWNIFGDPNGTDGNNGWGRRHPDAVSIQTHPTEGTVLQIEAFMGTTGPETGLLVHGGLALRGGPGYSFQYGRVRVRARVDVDPDEVTSGLALLWPLTNIKGYEVNIFENFAHRATRNPVQNFLHWGNGIPQRKREHDGVGREHGPLATSDWHDYEMIWLPNLVAVSIDGLPPQVLGTAAGEVPDEPMNLHLQLDAWPNPSISNPDQLNPAHQPSVTAPLIMEVSSLSVEVLA